jgi:hypothetical protein
MLNEEIAVAMDAPYEAAREEGRKEERAAVVSWLRSLFPAEDDNGFHRLIAHLAVAIESKEHLE